MKELLNKYILIVILYFFICGCHDNLGKKEEVSDLNTKVFVQFNRSINDSLEAHIPILPDSCIGLLMIDGSYIKNKMRINYFSIYSPIDSSFFKMYTIINDRVIFIENGIEYMLEGAKIYRHSDCDTPFFVLYDSIGVINVFEGHLDFSDEMTPAFPRWVPPNE